MEHTIAIEEGRGFYVDGMLYMPAFDKPEIFEVDVNDALATDLATPELCALNMQDLAFTVRREGTVLRMRLRPEATVCGSIKDLYIGTHQLVSIEGKNWGARGFDKAFAQFVWPYLDTSAIEPDHVYYILLLDRENRNATRSLDCGGIHLLTLKHENGLFSQVEAHIGNGIVPQEGREVCIGLQEPERVVFETVDDLCKYMDRQDHPDHFAGVVAMDKYIQNVLSVRTRNIVTTEYLETMELRGNEPHLLARAYDLDGDALYDLGNIFSEYAQYFTGDLQDRVDDLVAGLQKTLRLRRNNVIQIHPLAHKLIKDKKELDHDDLFNLPPVVAMPLLADEVLDSLPRL